MGVGAASNPGGELRERINQLFVRRLRVGLWICLLIYLLFGLVVLWLPGPSPAVRSAVALIRFFCVAVFAAELAALRSAQAQHRPVPFGVLATTLVSVSSGVSGVLLPEDNLMVPMSFVVQAMFSATLIPWGLGGQILIVAIQTLTLVVNAALVYGSLAPIGQPLYILTFVAFGVSLCIAYEFRRYRVGIEDRELERDRAVAALRESETRFRSLSAAAPIGSCRPTARTRVVCQSAVAGDHRAVARRMPRRRLEQRRAERGSGGTARRMVGQRRGSARPRTQGARADAPRCDALGPGARVAGPRREW
jgi:hypothetical protein